MTSGLPTGIRAAAAVRRTADAGVEAAIGNHCFRAIGITEANLSLLKSGKVKGLRFSTLEAICRVLDCQPGDLLEYEPGPEGALKD